MRARTNLCGRALRRLTGDAGVISDNGHLPLPSQDEQQQQLQWHIKNKYYSATVSFQCLTGDLHAALEKIQSVPAVVVLVGDIEQVKRVSMHAVCRSAF